MRSLLAPWIGGAGSASTPSAGVRGMLAPWIGGASAPSAVDAGYRGLLAFWMGGASSSGDVQHPSGGIVRLPRRSFDSLRRQRIEEDDMLLILAYQHSKRLQ